ncbi:acyltransferase family protein [Prauserella alba]|uniref:Acyltransferase 3 domain-containing protein n=1 Tax=Prauserella alba TaxID=176898 RepID=A0ABN1V215_9PSEU|nr:acyltransferase family protein [Prauserella alba]MCP2178776.1 Acyltransferase family [Prauserella alba]
MTTSLSGAPHTRDRFLDLIRTLAVVGVVTQHWAMPVLGYSGGTLTTGNALATPGWWVVTWLSQVMPLVFFAGGAANLISLRRAHSRADAQFRADAHCRADAHSRARRAAATRGWLAGRLRRLLLPVLPLLAVWLVVPTVLSDLGVPDQPVAVAGAIAAQLLWFLAVYLLTVVATPLMAAAHHRFGFAVVPALALAAAAVDIARFGDVPLAGYANAAFVWLAAAQLGFHYADGPLARLSPLRSLALSAAGFGATALLVAFGPYAASMIGMPGAPVSNMSPPNVALIGLAVGQVGLVLAARPQLTRFAARRPVAAALSWAGPRFMSIYLWHMPALIVVAGVTVVGLGYTTPEPGTPDWLVMLPAWLTASAAVLTVLVRIAGRFETALPRTPEPRQTGTSTATSPTATSPAATTAAPTTRAPTTQKPTSRTAASQAAATPAAVSGRSPTAPPMAQLVTAALLGATGLLGLAARGFGDGPELWAALVVGAFALSRRATSDEPSPSRADALPDRPAPPGTPPADHTSSSLAGVS